MCGFEARGRVGGRCADGQQVKISLGKKGTSAGLVGVILVFLEDERVFSAVFATFCPP